MLIALSVLFVAVCVIPAVSKLAGHPHTRRSAQRFGIPWRRYQLIAVPELAAAAGGLVGLFWRPAGVLAASGMILLVVGALIFHRRARDTVRDAMPALVALVVTLAYLVAAFAA
jgi:hypothetical protein